MVAIEAVRCVECGCEFEGTENTPCPSCESLVTEPATCGEQVRCVDCGRSISQAWWECPHCDAMQVERPGVFEQKRCCLCSDDYWVLYGDPDPGFCTFSCSEVYYERASLPPVVALDDSMLPF